MEKILALSVLDFVANSSPQNCFRACICFNFAKFSANVFSLDYITKEILTKELVTKELGLQKS